MWSLHKARLHFYWCNDTEYESWRPHLHKPILAMSSCRALSGQCKRRSAPSPGLLRHHPEQWQLQDPDGEHDVWHHRNNLLQGHQDLCAGKIDNECRLFLFGLHNSSACFMADRHLVKTKQLHKNSNASQDPQNVIRHIKALDFRGKILHISDF